MLRPGISTLLGGKYGKIVKMGDAIGLTTLH